MIATLKRRVDHLEVRSGVDRGPWESRIVVRACERASLEGETCNWYLWSGTLFELVRRDHCRAGNQEPSHEELERFIASTPIEPSV